MGLIATITVTTILIKDSLKTTTFVQLVQAHLPTVMIHMLTNYLHVKPTEESDCPTFPMIEFGPEITKEAFNPIVNTFLNDIASEEVRLSLNRYLPEVLQQGRRCKRQPSYLPNPNLRQAAITPIIILCSRLTILIIMHIMVLNSNLSMLIRVQLLDHL